LVDQRTQLSLKLTPSIIDAAQRTRLPANIYIPEWTGAPTEALESIARQAGEHSRYYIDPCLADHVGPTLFTAWLRNLCAGRLHSKTVLVAYDASTHSPVGLLTLGGAEPGLNIGLLAVDWAARGRGVGRSLMQAAVSWATAQPRRYMEIQVVTQGGNTAALALYDSCGYGIDEVKPMYHFWVKE